ncbi:unnamed protein product [Acanthoscelides obtectus]|nr:unnamed protein product [Acanthoscelides obtectus]CAK1637379.1 Alpha-N-acetylglucosaminidase [Acanthoscelides obtectus]
MIKRTTPNGYKLFLVKVDPDFEYSGREAFKIQKGTDGLIRITGTTGVAVATAFNYYLKYFCNVQISWEFSRANLPEILPEINETITLNDRFRYYQNVCTTSYTFVWWQWEDWEKHIDWMALSSFNLILASTGQEAIWDKVYKRFNLTQKDIDEHFTGPAFLSWLRMGNIRGWAGPLSTDWHEKSVRLQKQILSRIRSFGMLAVLPAFAGHLPRAFKRLYPEANMTLMEPWNNFNDTYCCSYLLEPSEDLFIRIGKAFIHEQIAEFGTDHLYSCDSFNEMNPTSSELSYISRIGRTTFDAMTVADPKAIWVMQGWLFAHDILYWTKERARALLTSVPQGKMIVLDLQSEQYPQYDRLDQYFGQPYIWCMLHNFGGTLGMYGSFDIINQNVIKARNANSSTMIGTGLTPEGINQNYVIYDAMIESAWRKEPQDKEEFFRLYTVRRYGKANDKVIRGWDILKDSIYNYKGLLKIRGKYVITNTPSLRLFVWTWYNYTYLFDAWDLFLAAADDLKHSPGFLHDLVDVTRQVLQVYGDIYYKNLMTAYRIRNINKFRDVAEPFLDVFSDLEKILATNKAFLLGPWLESAKNCSSSPEEKIQFEYNARNQITLWGPKGEIMNYANKQWSGVVSHFFLPRWKLFVQSMEDALQRNIKLNEKLVKEKMFKEVEEPFTFDTTHFPTEPHGNTIEIAKYIHAKWRNRVDFHDKMLRRIRIERSSEEEFGILEYDEFTPEVLIV